MTTPTSTRAVVLERYAEAETDPRSLVTYFAVKELPLPNPLPVDSLLVKTLYLSNDPAQRLWLQKPGPHSGERADMAGIPLGTPFDTFLLARVVQVGGEGGPIKVGNLVEARGKWADYCVIKKAEARVRREIPGVPSSALLGGLGYCGATAYHALLDVLKLKSTDTLVVSGAAGAVGNVAVQYAKKVLGVKRVVGIAGSDAKCTWLKSIGADEAISYKNSTFAEDLATATPDKVDKFLDNMGGFVLDEVMGRMNPHGIVAAVGAISLYNNMGEPAKIKHYMKLITDRLSIVGYSIIDYRDRLDETFAALSSAAASGKLTLEGAETVVDIKGHLEEIPIAWAGLFTGANTGKLITKIAD